jgi:hypothetical protein
MNKAGVIEYLEANQDPRGIAYWKKHAEISGGLKGYGIGLTKLRKFAKQIGRDAKLAQQLWKTRIYEAKIIGLLIDDPKSMTEQQAEMQVEELQGGYLAHVFSSCDATLAKTPFVADLMEKWIASKDPVRRRCGYGLLYEISKSKKKTAPDEDAFLAHIRRIEKTWSKAAIPELMAMATALMGIGLRSRNLNTAAIRVAKQIGPIDFDADGKCDPMDIAKRLQSDFVRKKLGK